MKYVRRLPLSGACNVRDLGGYPCAGGSTKWHCCYRGDMLHQLTPEDWKQLQERKVGVILDLRSTLEQKQGYYDSTPYGITHISLPLMKAELPLHADLDEEARKQFLNSMELDYVVMAQEGIAPLCQGLTMILETLRKGEAVLFHCTAGKDRTGIMAAALFNLCGVSDEDILADYQVSQTYNQPGVNNMLPKELLDNPKVKALFESTPNMLQPLLDDWKQHPLEEALCAQGMKKEALEELKTYLIEP